MGAIADVVDRMREIDRELDPRDGVACFNRVYLRVTELVAARLTEGFFEDGRFVERLDELFAGLYFANVADGGADPSWRPLFQARDDHAVWSLQFVLAGINAHVNHDLALAVVAACAERGVEPGTRPVHADFLRVNELLAQVEAQARGEVEPELLKFATKEAEALKHIVGSFSIARARDMAWCTVEALWPQREIHRLYDTSVAILAQTVGLTGRLLVTPVIPASAFD
ncbi:DUF5995 family protein [Actinomadura macrotermitis]|uniref:Uncharacterized protein n=1 Tax=Actinomadura macrotermitis TaxID=2585200 RepID=A0A7K0BX46_9ACTN|nr:DUF5995 family protein [Actinomadura macrotermitis]MQY05739.1 hypothetical protein [Actinomadura macrotermitis]